MESSPINVGSGSVDTEHGRLPVPAPATALLLKGAPVFADGEFERTTPTGALLVTGFAERFGPWPSMTLKKIGYGLGTKDPKDGRPNALRLVLGEASSRRTDSVVVLETTVDDGTPEQLGFLQERLWEAGALDVFLTPVIMKKNRPGTNLTVLVSPGSREAATEILFHESPTFGVRAYTVERDVLDRRFVTVKTRYGKVRVKEGSRGGKVVNAAPEYEDCRRLARAKKVSLETIQRAAARGLRGSCMIEDVKIAIDDFMKVELRVAKIIEASEIEGADRLLKLQVDLGSEKRQLVAGIKKTYTPEELVGKHIVVVVNLKPARLRGEESQGMLLAAQTDDGPALVSFDKDVPLGSIVK